MTETRYRWSAPLDTQTRGMMQELLLKVWEEHKVTVLVVCRQRLVEFWRFACHFPLCRGRGRPWRFRRVRREMEPMAGSRHLGCEKAFGYS
jgi:hypothetical protein